MNYRHAYHAGNFADVVKHVVLSRIIEYLKRKDAPFRVIDTHAGIGLYDLSSDEAAKTGEWLDGIGRIAGKAFSPEATALLAPYLDAAGLNDGTGAIKSYPGSPLIARRLLRKQDRLFAIELHPEDAAELRQLFAGDIQTRVLELDGWLALGAQLPPKERRGLVLVDPPFEEPGEFDRMADALIKAHQRWPGGIYALWYPVKNMERGRGIPRPAQPGGHPKDPRRQLCHPPALAGAAARRLRHGDRQSALCAGRRDEDGAACPARTARGRSARRLVGQMAGRRVAFTAAGPDPSSISYGLNGGNLSV